MTRNIGLKVNPPSKECSDRHCPFHGGLAIRGKLFDGKAKTAKAKQTVTIRKDMPIYYTKFKRYARSTSTIHAHVPECMEVSEGDMILAAECRPISKSVSFVVVEARK